MTDKKERLYRHELSSGIESRKQIEAFITAHPGLHTREISRRMNIPLSTIRYHMIRLERERAVLVKNSGKYTRYYPPPEHMAKDDWERKIKKVTKLDPGGRNSFPPPILEAIVALDQIKSVHGHTPFETHGFEGFRFINTFPPGTEKWDKDYEYRIFLKDSLLQEETSFHKERILDENGWMSLEAYAIENIGIKEDIVYKGNLFRHSYLGCSKRMGCIKKEGNGSMQIDNTCRQKCQDIAIEETDFFTKEEAGHFRKTSGLMV
jgi:DNA-binding transcriptional ArsR family regulator